MKKVLLLSLGLLVGMAGFAQVKSMKEAAKQCVEAQKTVMNGTEVTPASNYSAPSMVLPSVTTTQLRGGEATLMPTMTTAYDLQSNSALANRIAAWADGTVAVTATWDPTDSPWSERGTGYNIYVDGEFGEEPEARQEPAKSGWPSICAYGDGEILASHNTGVNVYYRATKGEGEWEFLTNLQSNGQEWTWPRVASTTDGALHLFCANQYTDAGGHNVSVMTYFRSTDGGHNWTESSVFGDLSAEYNLLISADDYVVATNGNRIAVACFSMTYDIFYMWSEDGGLNWEKKVVCENPIKAATGSNFDWGQTTIGALSDDVITDSIYWNDNSGSIAIGNDGTVHMTWAIGRWTPAPKSGWGYYTYWPYTIGAVYWNSNFVNEQGTNQIPTWGDWSGDAEFESEFIWPGQVIGGYGHIMDTDRIEAMADAEGNHNLHFYGYASENTPGDPEGPAYQTEIYNNKPDDYGYKTFNILGTMHSIAVDNDNSVYILYSGLSDKRTGSTPAATQFYLRSPFLHTCVDGEWEPWYDATVIATGVAHNREEAYSFTAYPNEVNGEMWFCYSADTEMGLYLDGKLQQSPTENTIYAVKVAKIDEVSEVKDVVYNIYPNPASDYICIAADAAAEATITFVNLAGQTVKTINTSLTIGNNSLSIDLASGVYFCTVNANGFSKTTKVVVK